MATKGSTTSAHSKGSGTKERSKHHAESPARLKSVVRRLPPNLPEAVFWQSVEPWVSDSTVAWKVFYPGKFRKRLNKENIPSRAYLLFKNEDNLATFSREYDGHTFRDKQGNESQAVVEFAPNQKVPSEKKKLDARHATIQQDEDYLSFVAALEDPESPPEVNIETLLASVVLAEEQKMTPLLAALQEQKQAAQEKKIAIAESTKSRKAAAAAAATPGKKEADQAPSGRKGRRAKGAQPVSQATTAVPSAAAPTTKASRSRASKSSTEQSSTQPATGASVGASSTSIVSEEQRVEAPSKKARAVVGLQSRHLKAALTGAGVQVPAANTPSLASTSETVVSPSATEALSPKPSRSRKEGVGKEGGGRGGKDRGRGRTVASANRVPDAPLRILTRPAVPPDVGESTTRASMVNHSTSQEPPTPSGAASFRGGGDLNVGKVPGVINIATGDVGSVPRGGKGGRGRGRGRGRGQ